MGDSNPKPFASVCHWHSGVIMGDHLSFQNILSAVLDGRRWYHHPVSFLLCIGFLRADSFVFFLVLAEDERDLCLLGAEDLLHCCGFFPASYNCEVCPY